MMRIQGRGFKERGKVTGMVSVRLGILKINLRLEVACGMVLVAGDEY